MERISTFLDIEAAILKGQEVPRKYERKIEVETYDPERSRFKAVIYFKDNNRRHFYSYDLQTFNFNTHLDEFNGLKKLIRLIVGYSGKYKTAVIYATLDPGKDKKSNYCIEVAKFLSNGTKSTNDKIRFKNDQKNVSLDTNVFK